MDIKKITVKKHQEIKLIYFQKFTHNFKTKDDVRSNFTFQTQDVSNDKYLKLYKIETDLIDYNQDYLENSINYTKTSNDYFFSIDGSIHETLKADYNDKYEYIYLKFYLIKIYFNQIN